MPADVAGLDPLTVSLRDYVDGMQEQWDKGALGLAERHHDEWAAHHRIHSLEKEAISILAAMVASQRLEDSHEVETALKAVQTAAQIHAAAHEQQHQAHQSIHDVEKEAILKATQQMDKRLEGMNAFRDALRDQGVAMMPRELALSQIDAVRREQAAQLEDLRGTLFTLHSRLDVIQGQSKGANAAAGYVIAAAGLLLSLVAVAVTLALR